MHNLGLLGMYFDAVVVEVKIDFFYFYSNGSGHTVSRLLTCIYSVHKSFTFPCEENNILFKPHMGTMYMPKGFGLLVLL